MDTTDEITKQTNYWTNCAFALNQMMKMMLESFIDMSTKPWKVMAMNHIQPFAKDGIDLLNMKRFTISNNTVNLIDAMKNKLPEWFIVSSGTAEKIYRKEGKIIPQYKQYQDIKPILCIDIHFPRGWTAMIFHCSPSINLNGIQCTDLMTRSIQQMFGTVLGQEYLKAYTIVPDDVMMIHDPYTSYYNHLKYALLCENLTRIAIYSNRQVLLIIRMLMDRKKDLIKDIENVSVDRALHIAMSLETYLHQEEKGLDKSSNSSKALFEMLWPNLRVICCATSGTMRIYSNRLKKYLGNIPLFDPVYLTVETVVGYNLDNDGSFVVDPSKGYFEFLEVNNQYLLELSRLPKNKKKGNIISDNISTKSLRNVAVGDYLMIVVSTVITRSVRNIMDDLVQCVGHFGLLPKLKLVCRMSDVIIPNYNPTELQNLIKHNTKQLHCVIPEQLEHQLSEIYSDGTNGCVVDYGYSLDHENQILNCWVEIESHHMIQHSDGKFVGIKKQMKELNPNKILGENLGSILKFSVNLVEPGSFDTLYAIRYGGMIDCGAIQIPRMLTGNDLFQIKKKTLYTYG